MKKSIAIDMDQTVADTLQRHLEWYYREFGVKLTKQDTLEHRIYEVIPPEHLATVREFPNHPDFFRDLDIFPDAQAVIKRLSKHYDIYFASAAMEHANSFTAKYEWLQKHFPFIDPLNYIFCGVKHMLNCDYLIDDSTRHIDVFPGTGLLFTAEHNIHKKDFQRVNNWLEIEALLSQ